MAPGILSIYIYITQRKNNFCINLISSHFPKRLKFRLKKSRYVLGTFLFAINFSILKINFDNLYYRGDTRYIFFFQENMEKL